jgi:hypothetical protein
MSKRDENFKCWFLQVIEQSHRREQFGDKNNCGLWESNGFRLISQDYISTVDSCDEFYVRGSSMMADNDIVCIPFNQEDYYKKIIHAVREYNKYYCDAKIKKYNKKSGITIIK